MRKAPGLASRCKCWGCAPAPVMPWLRPSWPRLPRRRIIRPRDRRPETRDDWDGLVSGRLARTGLAACWARGPRLIRQSWPRQRPCRTCRDLLCPREMRRRRTQVRRKRVNFGLPRIGTGGQANAGRGAELIHGTPDFGSQRPNGSRQRCVQSLVCIAHLLTSRLGTGDIARADSALRTLHSTLNVLARVRSLCRPSRYRARFLRRPHRALR